MADSGADAIGLDWTIDIGDARKRVGKKVSLQGNLDPSALYASPEVIKKLRPLMSLLSGIHLPSETVFA